MTNKPKNDPGMTTRAIYQITVKGKLTEHWADWFNGTVIDRELGRDGGSHTKLTCRVRDQSELMGILNQLNSLNLPLLRVVFINENNI
jgi:hypothetical protein